MTDIAGACTDTTSGSSRSTLRTIPAVARGPHVARRSHCTTSTSALPSRPALPGVHCAAVNTTTATNVLLLIIAGLLFEHFHPAAARELAPAAAVVAALWALNQLYVRWRLWQAERAQKKHDQLLWREYDAEHKAIRRKYDPKNEWNEATSTPREYREEIDELNHTYHDMLKRRFGDDWDD